MITTYDDYRELIDAQIAQSKEHIAAQLETTIGDIVPSWRSLFDACLETVLGTPAASKSLVHPPKRADITWKPDYALPMFMYAKERQQNPAALATEAAKALMGDKNMSRVEATGPYLNMQLNDATLMAALQQVLSEGKNYGSVTDNTGKVAIVEYSSPNVAKPFGINHLRSTVIGEAIARLYRATGYAVIRDNHIGDWGTQFGNLLAAHQEYADDRDFSALSMDELTALYVRFNQEKKTSPRLVKMGQACFAKLEAGDPELRQKWAIALSRSLQEFSAMYKRLNIDFDTTIGEGYFVEAANKLVDDLASLVPADLVVFDQDTKAVYVNAEHPVVIRTQDGYGVYAARDLATIQFRQNTYSPDAVVYVVGDEQSSYFRSIFEVANKANLTTRSNGSNISLSHVNFGLLLDTEGKKLSTRKGTSGKLEDVIDALDEHATAETQKRNQTLPASDITAIAKKISVGALIWNDLRTDRTSNVRFDIEKMLELGGGSVIDVLYTYSRTSSILDKLAVSDDAPFPTTLPAEFSTEIEHQLALYMSEFEDTIRKAADSAAPHILVQYLQELSQLHGRFYEESRVAGLEDQQIADLRITLHRAYKVVIQNGLGLLNIPVSKRL